MDQQTMLLAGGVTAVVSVAVTAMWMMDNMGSSKVEPKKERKERGKKASQMKPKKVAAQDAPAQRAAAPAPAPPAPKAKAAAPAPAPAPAKEEGKKNKKGGGKGGEEASKAAPAPTASAGKKKKGKSEAAPAQPTELAGEGKNGKKKKDKSAQQQADIDDGWCQVGKGGKPKEGAVAKPVQAAAPVSNESPLYMGVADSSATFAFEVPVGAGGDFLQTSTAPSGAGAVAGAADKKKKNKKGVAVDLHTGSNGWSPAADEVANTVARDLATMTIAPSPVKKVVEEDEWATVPVKTKKKSSKA